MSGLPIPSDWDQETYKCYKIYWPKSVQYESVLLGQLSEPQQERFWLPGSGDPQEVTLALLGAEVQTAETFFTEDCEDVQMAVARGFKVWLSSNLTLPAGEWVKIAFGSSYTYEQGQSGYQPGSSEHHPWLAGLPNGLWSYSVAIRANASINLWVRAQNEAGGTIWRTWETDRYLVGSFDHRFLTSEHKVYLEAMAPGGGSLDSGEVYTHWSGHYLGSTS